MQGLLQEKEAAEFYIAMRKCCGCKGGEVAELDEAKPFDLSLIEVDESKLSLGFRTPRSGSKIGGSTFRAGRGSLEFIVSVLGGPYSDCTGGREERITGVSCGSLVVHEVANLQPETEYTIRVMLESPSVHSSASSSRPAVVAESIEVRTANATTALLAGEDWGHATGKLGTQGFAGKDGKGKGIEDCEKDPKGGKAGAAQRYYGGASSSSSSWAGAAPAASSAAAATQDDVSTNAPSDAGDARNEIVSVDSGSEHGDTPRHLPAEPVASTSETADTVAAAADVEEITVVEAKSTRRGFECKLCSIIDCFKTSRGQAPATDPDDLVIERRPVQAAPKRVRRPYRMPFPGIPVDPASVGLMPRHDYA